MYEMNKTGQISVSIWFNDCPHCDISMKM